MQMNREQVEDRLMEVISVDDNGESLPMLKMIGDAIMSYDKHKLPVHRINRIIGRLHKAVYFPELDAPCETKDKP